MSPFFSVVIPTYNCARKLKRTIESVLAQSFADFELLVMDDGSTDDTEAVVASFRDPRIRYAWAANSGGPATPRNRGIDAARAEWICFLDADDIWYPAKLEAVARVIRADPEVDLVSHDEFLSVLATGTKVTLRHGPYEEDFYRVMLTGGNRVSTSATTVRKDFLLRFGLRFNQSPDYVIVEDYDMWLRIAFHGGRFHFLREILGEYVIEDGNISANLARLQHNHAVLLHDHVFSRQAFAQDKERLWRQVNARLLLMNAKNLLASRKFVAGIAQVFLAFRSSFSGTLGYVRSALLDALPWQRRSS